MTQNEAILKHLQHSPITSLEALGRYGCLRLAARVKELRDSGHIIESQMIERHGKRFSLYRLVK